MNSLDKISGFLLDMDGTFYLGDALLPGATHFLDVLATQGKEYLFLTNNSSQNRISYAQKFTRLGLSIPEDKILTSGEATVRHLQISSRATRVYVVGTPDMESEFQEAGYTLDDAIPELVVLGFDTTLSWPGPGYRCHDRLRQSCHWSGA
jgi:4-nitrophenyl phosphatase